MITVKNMGLTQYMDCYKYQTFIFENDLVRERKEYLLITEHEPVFTIGVKRERLGSFQGSGGIPLVYADRGGDITLHNPGQFVAYPLIDIGRRGIKVVRYVYLLEQTIIDTLTHFGVETRRNYANNGVWIDLETKIAFVGVRHSGGLVMHGISVNVNNDLEPFKLIKPCGLSINVTSVKELLGHELPLHEFRDEFVANFKKHIGE